MSPKKRYKFTGTLSHNGFLQSDKPPVGKGRFIRLRNRIPSDVLERLANTQVTIEIIFDGDGEPYYETLNQSWETFYDVLGVRIISQNPLDTTSEIAIVHV